jgi:hypothetical protein
LPVKSISLMKLHIGLLITLFFVLLSCQKKDINPSTEFQLDKSSITFNNCSAKDSFTIKSEGNWTISISPSNSTWLQLGTLSGNGTIKVIVTAIAENQSNAPRTATLTIHPSNASLEPISISVTQLPIISWSGIFGGSRVDYVQCITAANDGGFVMAGSSESIDGDLNINHGYADAWVLKLDANGKKIWSKAFGGSDIDGAYSMISTPDGGILMAGITMSNNGDVSGYHGTQDIWVLKLDPNSNKIWSKLFGASLNELAPTIIATGDGGFLLSGLTDSNDGYINGNHGDFDAWVMKIDADGNQLWNKTFGGSGVDYAQSIVATSDGGFVIAGQTTSNDGDVSGNHGSIDAWVLKADANGTKIWSKAFGGSGMDDAASITATTDGGFVIAGSSTSNDGDLSNNYGNRDTWILKLDASGSKIWSKNYGGSSADRANSIISTVNKELVIAGITDSNDGDVSNNHGGSDAWVLKLDFNGNKQCSKAFGGSNFDEATSITATSDGGFVIVGETLSNDGIVKPNHGSSDAFIIKFNF